MYMNIAICDDDLLYMNQVKEMIEKWGKEHHEDVSIYLFNHGDALINSYQKSHIEVILLDIIMPLLNGMETAHEIRKNDSVVKIIFLTSSPEFALESYDVKASGYLLKGVSMDGLTNAIRTVYSGQAMINPDIATKVVRLFSQMAKADYVVDVDQKRTENLTKTEWKIINEVGRGSSNKEIAENLNLSEGTVRNYLSGILNKLEFRDRTQLAIWAVQNKVATKITEQ